MKNILKLTGVSMLAIMATTNANAAGYTCEELIEYTSCNPGYWLSSACPIGYTYGNGWCVTDADLAVRSGYDKQSCLDAMCDGDTDCEENYDSIYLGDGCFKMGEEATYDFVPAQTIACNECPIGSTCAGGTAGATTCPAGSYCATAGLSQPTGKCAVGTYSTGGATSASCTSCPSSDLTDANGDVVSVTTASTGSTSSSACFVAKGTEFKDAKGVYRYTDNCQYGNYSSSLLDYSTIVINNADECAAIGGIWDEEDPEYVVCWMPGSALPQNKDECKASGLYWFGEFVRDNCMATCFEGLPDSEITSSVFFKGEPGLQCE